MSVRSLVATVVGCLLLTTGCTSLSGTDGKGYVTGDGTVRVVEAVDRGDPVDLRGEDLDGKPIDLADYRGKPVVVVVWGSWCGPCRAEAPDVVAAAKQIGDAAEFVGIDLRDPTTAAGKAFVRSFDVPYPSVFSPDGEALLSFPGTLGPRTIPAFVVLDGEGRIAASIIGSLPSKQTLVDLVSDVASGSSASASGERTTDG